MMDLDNTERKIIRGEILKILKISYPDGVSDKLLRSTLGRMVMNDSPGILRGHCEYLRDKDAGYISIDEVDFGDIQYICRITKKGIDLLENRNINDPGVEL